MCSLVYLYSIIKCLSYSVFFSNQLKAFSLWFIPFNSLLYFVRLEREAGWAVIHFQDSAPGVPEDELERLFERLYRVESSRNRNSGGAGLGLSICRNIVEAHGGTISAQTSPLGGVGITVRLPLEEVAQ